MEWIFLSMYQQQKIEKQKTENQCNFNGRQEYGFGQTQTQHNEIYDSEIDDGYHSWCI